MLPHQHRLGGAPAAVHQLGQRQAAEYLYAHDPRDGGGHVIYMERGGKWQPVSAVCLAGHISGGFDHDGRIIAQPGGEFAGLNALDGVFWNDKNTDGRVQRDSASSCRRRTLATPWGKPKAGAARRRCRWTTAGAGGSGRTWCSTPTGCGASDPRGSPTTGRRSIRPPAWSDSGPKERGDLVPVPEENLLLCLSFKGYAERHRDARRERQERGGAVELPEHLPGVHGSHHATMPAPGLLIGP